MDIVEFLEARIDEEEAELLHAESDDPSDSSSLVTPMLAECAQKRAILDCWKRAVSAEGAGDITDAQGELAMARRSMLNILAAGYEGHPDFEPEWGRSPRLTGARLDGAQDLGRQSTTVEPAPNQRNPVSCDD